MMSSRIVSAVFYAPILVIFVAYTYSHSGSGYTMELWPVTASCDIDVVMEGVEVEEVIDCRQKVQAGKIDGKRKAKKEISMPDEERKEKCRKRVEKFRAKMSPEEKDRVRESDTESRRDVRAKMSPEEKDRVRESNTESRRDCRSKMPPEEKGKEKEKRGRRVKEGKKMEQQFCRGHIYDDSRQLQTVWILENEKKKRRKKEANGGVKIVKKYENNRQI